MKRDLPLEIIDKVRRKVTKISTVISVALILSSCIGTSHLKENQKVLYKQSIEAPRSFDKQRLNDIYVQKPNRRFLGLPINTLTWMYYWGEKSFQKESAWPFRSKQNFIRKRARIEKKFNDKIAKATTERKTNNLQFRKQQKLGDLDFKIENGNNPMQWGEKVVVYDSASTRLTNEKINQFLFNNGYFEGKTTANVDEHPKKVNVKYIISPGTPYLYDTIMYQVADSAVLLLIRQTEEQALIKKGDRYDQRKLSSERDRMDQVLKDHGYYDFSRQYVDFQVDTTYKHKHAIALQISISDPVARAHHKVFHVDSVSFTTDASLKADTLKRKSELYKDIRYRYFVDQYSKKILNQRVFIHHDSMYSRSNTLATQRQLANLDIFKFVNINYDTSGGRFLANIFASPLDRYSWTNEAGVTVTQGYPGPYYSLSFKKRNIFGGLEIFELNGRFGFEGVAAATSLGSVYQSTEANINTSVTFPQFLLPLGKRSESLGRYNPKTKLLAGFTYTDRPEYRRSNVTISDTYTWEDKRRTLYSFTLLNFQVIQSTLSNDFDSLLTKLQTEQGNNLKNSFKPSLVSSMIFSMTWNPNDYTNAERSSYFLRVQAESGGTLFNFYDPKFATERGLETYQYLRLGVDLRRKKVLDKNTTLAFHFNTGIGYAYGKNLSLPYEKYFFAGGSNSVRAWRPRRLGLGSAPPQLNADPASNGLFNYQYEKPGEILLEASVEWRKKLFGFVSGALFIDAGNVWSFQQISPPPPGPTTPSWADKGNTKFYFNSFYKEIAVGTGFGVRFDFSFLVLRLDMGIKAWDPSRPEGERFVLNKFSFTGPYGPDSEPYILNIGIGYPF